MVSPSPLLLGYVALVGAVIGSFGNVLILRIPEGESIAGRSACPRCHRRIRWFDLIPVVSYVLLLGRCRHCKRRISAQYPCVEAATAVAFVLAAFMAPSIAAGIALALALWLLLLLAVIDARTGTVPDVLSIPFIITAIAWHLLAYSLASLSTLTLAIGGCAGFIGIQWAVSRGRWVGSGDILLAAGIGALVTTPVHAILALGLSYIVGALVASVLLSMRQRTLASELPFGPFLAIGGFAIFLWGNEIAGFIGV